MEIASNLVWILVSIALLAWILRATQRGRLRVSARSAFVLVVLICLLLLPAISVTDNLLEARQAQLPASAQTWHIASQDISSAVEISSLLLAFLLIALILTATFRLERWNPGRNVIAAWLTRTHSLRPPPALAS